jgi:hypothetical protein
VHATDPEAANEGVFTAEWAGLGFAAIHRESLERVARALPTIEGDTAPWQPFCVPFVDGSTYYADDRSLWERLRRLGVGLVADRLLTVGHAAELVLSEPRA